MMNRATLSIELDAAGKAPPTEFRIFAFGEIETTKGTFKFDGSSAKAVMSKVADWGNDYCLDYGHSMLSFFTVDPAESMKAAGWFKPELRNGELWASKVQWTDKAAAMLSAREARYVSPAFNYDEDGAIVELVNVALTNIPATKKQPPLMASRAGEADKNPKKEKSMSKKISLVICGALGLSADADDASILAKLSALQARARVADDLEKADAATEAKLNALTGKTSFGESLGVVQSWKDSAATVVTLSTKIVELEQKGRETEVLTMVELGVKEGKIAPAQKEMWLERGKKDPEFLKGFLSTASQVVPGKEGAAQEKAKGTTVELSAEQKKAAEKLGIKDPDVLAAIGQSMTEKADHVTAAVAAKAAAAAAAAARK